MVECIKGWYRQQGLLPRVVIGAVAVLAVILVFYGLWTLLLVFVKPHTVAQKTSFVQMVVGMIGGLTLIGGLLVNFWGQGKNQRAQNENQKATLAQLDLNRKAQNENQKATLAQLDLTRQGQITDRFTQAIDQLGKTDDEENKIEEVRLGGIYALEQIAVDEPEKYHWPIMQVFAAYLRRYASWQDNPYKVTTPTADIQTVLNVIARRSRYYEAGEDERLSLDGTDFSSYWLPNKAHLEGASLVKAHLENAVLLEAQLQKADLRAAHLEGTWLVGADLRDADLRGAHLEGAYLLNADLRGANLRNAYLTATHLSAAKLPEESKLDPESLEEANGDWSTEVGEIPRPRWWGLLMGNDVTLEPGDYSIMLWKTPLYLRALREGWYSSLSLPQSVQLSPAGVPFAGVVMAFFSGPQVCDPHKPKEASAFEPAPKDMVDWFENHPHLTLTTKPQEWENPSGGAHGMEFYVGVNPATPENELGMSSEGSTVAVFPLAPRTGSYTLVKGKTTRIIVLERESERIVIILESPAGEFNKFKDRVDEEILANLSWGKNPDEQPEDG